MNWKEGFKRTWQVVTFSSLVAIVVGYSWGRDLLGCVATAVRFQILLGLSFLFIRYVAYRIVGYIAEGFKK